MSKGLVLSKGAGFLSSVWLVRYHTENLQVSSDNNIKFAAYAQEDAVSLAYSRLSLLLASPRISAF